MPATNKSDAYIVFRLLQSLNIPYILPTFDVSHELKSNVHRFDAPLNISCIFSTFDVSHVSNPAISFKLLSLLLTNKSLKSRVFVKSHPVTSTLSRFSFIPIIYEALSGNTQFFNESVLAFVSLNIPLPEE